MAVNASSDTPTDPIPTRRHGDQSAAATVLEMLEAFRLEVGNAFRETREDAKQQSREIGLRLSGIESRLAEGSATISKHDGQILELAAENAELTRRMTALESKQADREGRESEARDIARVAAKARGDATGPRAMSAFVVGAAGACGTLAVGIVVWLVVAWARLGAPGANVPGVTPASTEPAHAERPLAPEPTQAGAHP